MDGFDPKQGVIIRAATNRPEILEPALLRPERFDRHVLVDRPDLLGREAILETKREVLDRIAGILLEKETLEWRRTQTVALNGRGNECICKSLIAFLNTPLPLSKCPFMDWH